MEDLADEVDGWDEIDWDELSDEARSRRFCALFEERVLPRLRDHADCDGVMAMTTKEGKGMGFGLFWTKDYVEGLGGEILVNSTVGEGTTFTILLPVMDTPAQA